MSSCERNFCRAVKASSVGVNTLKISFYSRWFLPLPACMITANDGERHPHQKVLWASGLQEWKDLKWNQRGKNGLVMTARHLFLSVAWVSASVCDLCSVASSVSVASADAEDTLSTVKQASPDRSNLGFTSGFDRISLPFFRSTPVQHAPRKDFSNRNRVQGVTKFLPLSRQ